MINKNEYHKQYYLKNKDRMKETHKQWVENNAEHVKKYRKEYYREYHRRKSARKKLIDRILAINLCLIEAQMTHNTLEIKLWKNLLDRAINEGLNQTPKTNI